MPRQASISEGPHSHNPTRNHHVPYHPMENLPEAESSPLIVGETRLEKDDKYFFNCAVLEVSLLFILQFFDVMTSVLLQAEGCLFLIPREILEAESPDFCRYFGVSAADHLHRYRWKGHPLVRLPGIKKKDIRNILRVIIPLGV